MATEGEPLANGGANASQHCDNKGHRYRESVLLCIEVPLSSFSVESHNIQSCRVSLVVPDDHPVNLFFAVTPRA